MPKEIKADVAIIGGGIVGTAVARELSRYNLKVVLVEKQAEVGWGTTKANSGIVHAGFHDKPGSLKAKYCVEGNRLYPQLCKDLDVSFQQNGILMVARNEEELEILNEYLERGLENGIPGLRIIGKEELHALEPNLNAQVLGALLAPSGGVVAPFELAAALMENAIENGVQLFTNNPVLDIEVKGDDKIITTSEYEITAKAVVNAAGLYGDAIAKMMGDDYFSIHPRKGEEYLFDKAGSYIVTRTIFPVPSKISKGMLAIPTSEGNLMIGPTGDDVPEKEDISTSQDGFNRIAEGVMGLVDGIDPRKIIAEFAGVRAASNRHDFIVEESPNIQGVIHLAGLESPGLTAAPAIAVEAVRLIGESGVSLEPKADFNPIRRPVIRFHQLSREEQEKLIKENPTYGRIVCRCETVTEGEIVDAIKRGARTLDGVKFRVRAGAGRCQGGFCQPLTMQIIARELDISVQQVTKRGPGTEQILFTAKDLIPQGGQDDENHTS